MEFSTIEYLKAKSVVMLYEMENTGVKDGKKHRNSIILLEHILSRRLYNSISNLLDYKSECSSRKLRFCQNIYNLNDLNYISVEEVKNCRNIGIKLLNEFNKWKSVAQHSI